MMSEICEFRYTRAMQEVALLENFSIKAEENKFFKLAKDLQNKAETIRADAMYSALYERTP